MRVRSKPAHTQPCVPFVGTDATSSCSSNYDQNDCENSCTVYSSDCIFASDCTASMHYQYNGWAGVSCAQPRLPHCYTIIESIQPFWLPEVMFVFGFSNERSWRIESIQPIWLPEMMFVLGVSNEHSRHHAVERIVSSHMHPASAFANSRALTGCYFSYSFLSSPQYKSCECIKTYTNGSSTTYKLCQDGPTGLGYWILFCCCGCCCVAGALMMHQKTQRDRRQREAAAAAQVQHQHPPAAPMYPQADQYNSPGFAQPTGAYGQPAYGQPAYPPPPFSGAPPGYDEASSRESQGMYSPPQGGAALYPPEKGDMGSTAI